MKKIIAIIVPCLLLAALLPGCETINEETIKVEKTVDSGGRWNDADARLVAEELIPDCLAASWLTDFLEDQGHPPVMMIGTIANLSPEPINTSAFAKSLEKNVFESGKVAVVSSSGDNTTEGDADFMLQGSITTVTDELDGKEVPLYQVKLELVDLTNHQAIWTGQTELKRMFSRTEYHF